MSTNEGGAWYHHLWEQEFQRYGLDHKAEHGKLVHTFG